MLRQETVGRRKASAVFVVVPHAVELTSLQILGSAYKNTLDRVFVLLSGLAVRFWGP